MTPEQDGEQVPASSVGEGESSRSFDRFRSVPEPDGSGVTESGTTVLVAFGANVLVAAAKSVAAAITGSASILAEAAQSWADAGNVVFLLVANRRSRRPPDSSHPLGYGREAYIWSLFAAMGLFIAGAAVSVTHGARSFSPRSQPATSSSGMSCSPSPSFSRGSRFFSPSGRLGTRRSRCAGTSSSM